MPVLSDIEFSKLLEDVRENRYTDTTLDLGHISIAGYCLSVEHIKDLCHALSFNTTIEKLILRGQGIGYSEIKFIADYIKENKTLRVLDLGRNALGYGKFKYSKYEGRDTAFAIFAEALILNRTIEELNVEQNALKISDMETLYELRELNNIPCKKLFIGENFIQADGMRYLAVALKNTALVELDVSFNHIENDGASSLAWLLKVNPALERLTASNNNIGSKGVYRLSENLKENKTLVALNLSGNLVGDKGVDYLGEALKVNTELSELNLRDCGINKKGFTFLMYAMKENKTLIDLNLSDNYERTSIDKKITIIKEILNYNIIRAQSKKRMLFLGFLNRFANVDRDRAALLDVNLVSEIINENLRCKINRCLPSN